MKDDYCPDIAVAYAAAFAEIGAATKGAVNPHFRSKYADLTSVIDAIKPALAKNDLFFIQACEPSDGGVRVKTTLWHKSGENIDLGTLYVPANKQDAQGFGSAITYARRYSLQTAFGVPTEDDDGNAAVKGIETRPTTGETPPNKRAKLDGPYTSPTALKAAAKQFAITLERFDDLGGLIGWEETQDYKDFAEQCAREMPNWWETGEGLPDEFVPLSTRVSNKRRELEELDGLRAEGNVVQSISERQKRERDASRLHGFRVD